ncbi:hypothetical protein [Paenibacillus taihuensis]|uniref:hypothetical protein n=1 Tax=Paenibacillus taihuensis TaxID=1156355 RepID=UPI0015F28766|nr:hypothetical protein [Paenibacillus taihuensis]
MGYPRIGADREWKKSLEAFWAGKIDEATFQQQQQQQQEIRLNHVCRCGAIAQHFAPNVL